jgi:glycosyltransferase involved in cell wall biosynthesis
MADASSVILAWMASRPPLSAIVITLNEEKNLPRCLASLGWAGELLVVDSGSTDRTRELAEQAGARVLEHSWEGYGQQKNWAMSQASQPWVLFLDADEEVVPELGAEIREFVSRNGCVDGRQFWGADMPRKTWFLGRWILHGGWYPNRLVRLAHRENARWTEPAVHERLVVQGAVFSMEKDLLHFTFRDVGDQVATNIRFSRLGARAAGQRGERGTMLKILLKPVGKFLETYLWKRGFLDGFPGFVISVNAAHSIFMKYVELRLEKNSSHR